MLSVITPARNMARYLPRDARQRRRAERPRTSTSSSTVHRTTAPWSCCEARDDPSLNWTSEPDRGQTEAVNKGLERSRGELIGWLNGDDAYLPAAVDRAVEHLERHPETMAVCGSINYVDESGAVFRTLAPPRFSWRRYLYLGSFLPTPTVIFRRRLLAQAPSLNEAYADAADYDFYLRLLRGARVDRIDEPLVNFRYHPASKTDRRRLDPARRGAGDQARLGAEPDRPGADALLGGGEAGDPAADLILAAPRADRGGEAAAAARDPLLGRDLARRPRGCSG